jgi:hypothetical protein
MLPTISTAHGMSRYRRTKLDGIVADQQRKHADYSCRTGSLLIRYNANGYTRSIHAQVRSRALHRIRIDCEERTRCSYDDIALGS